MEFRRITGAEHPLYEKAMELKDLTDELFRYFLVFGRAQPELAMEELEATLLLQQLLGEAEFDLADAGFTAEAPHPVCFQPWGSAAYA